MRIELLQPDRLNIIDLVVEEPKRRFLLNPDVQKAYHDLQQTPLYNRNLKLWYISYTTYSEGRMLFGGNGGPLIQSDDQLLSVCVQWLFDPYGARDQYRALQQTQLFNHRRNRWYHWIRKDGNLEWGPFYETSSQLLGVIVEALYNKKSAQAHFEALKQSPLFDPQSGLWDEGGFDAPPYAVRYAQRPTKTQLLGILTESIFNVDAATEQFKRLKKTTFYNKRNGSWNHTVYYRDRKPDITQPHSVDQLLSILIESRIDDITVANTHYEELRDSKLYNKKSGRWIESESDSNYVATEPQFLDILIQHAKQLFEDRPDFSEIEVPSLPQFRKF